MHGTFVEMDEDWGFLLYACDSCPFVDLAKRNRISVAVNGAEVCPASLFSIVHCDIYEQKKKRLGERQSNALDAFESTHKDKRKVAIDREGELRCVPTLPNQRYYISNEMTRKTVFLGEKAGGSQQPQEVEEPQADMADVLEQLQRQPEPEPEEIDFRRMGMVVGGVLAACVVTVVVLVVML